jgi:hypothetical protein
MPLVCIHMVFLYNLLLHRGFNFIVNVDVQVSNEESTSCDTIWLACNKYIHDVMIWHPCNLSSSNQKKNYSTIRYPSHYTYHKIEISVLCMCTTKEKEKERTNVVAFLEYE